MPDIVQGLPVEVRSFEDARALLRRFNESALFARGSIKKAIGFIEADEALYFLSTGTLYVSLRDSDKRHSRLGAIFLSNKRFLSYCWMKRDIIQFPLDAICTIAAAKGVFLGKISFRTPTLTMEFDQVGMPDVVRHVFINAIEGAPAFATAKCTARAVECVGCTATVIVVDGALSKCEYCGRHVILNH